MESVVHDVPGYERRVGERRRIAYPAFLRADGAKVSWGGIFGGVLVAVGLLLLLGALGLALGVAAVSPGETDMSTLGTGAGIWAGISLLIALFVGGIVSTRIGAIVDGTTGFFEGALVWVVCIMLLAYSAGSGIGLLAGGASTLVGGAAKTIGAAVQGTGGVDVSGSVDEIVTRLRDPQTAQKVASATGMPLDQVRSSMNDIAQRVNGARDNPAQALSEAKQGLSQFYEKAKSSGALERRAEEIQPGLTKAAWITFGALLLSLAAAVIGALLGRRETPAAAVAAPAR